MKTQNIELESLVGKHTLRGVFFDGVGSSQVLRFTLGKKHYEAVEDPCDDYRSCLERLSVSKIAPEKKIKPVKVVAEMHPQESEIIQFLNPKTKLCILEIGTTNSDDYYPGFVAEFHPENI